MIAPISSLCMARNSTCFYSSSIFYPDLFNLIQGFSPVLYIYIYIYIYIYVFVNSICSLPCIAILFTVVI